MCIGNNQLKPFHQDERGGVLLEYVILMLCIALPLITFNNMVIFNPSGMSADGTTASFGLLGDNFVELYKSIISGIGLPIP